MPTRGKDPAGAIKKDEINDGWPAYLPCVFHNSWKVLNKKGKRNKADKYHNTRLL